MKKILRPANLPYFTLGAGMLGFILRTVLLLTGRDDKGLLKPWQPAEVLIWLLTAAFIALAVWMTLRLRGEGKYARLFPASVPGAIGAAVAAAGIGYTAVSEMLTHMDNISIAGGIVGILSALSLLFLAFCRWHRMRPHIAFRAVVCVYFMLHALMHYRDWSAEPQLQNFCFQLFATVCTMLACYHRAAFEADEGVRRSYALSNQLAVYFCFLAIPGGGIFYLTQLIWMATDLCSMKPFPQRKSAPADHEAAS